jgi:hypothetical protein
MVYACIALKLIGFSKGFLLLKAKCAYIHISEENP